MMTDAEYIAVNLLGWKRYELATLNKKWERPQPRGRILLENDGYLETGNGMLEVIEAMRGRKYIPVLGDIETGQWRATFISKNGQIMRVADTLPLAVLKAARAALESE